jgi:transaldolase
MRFFIDSADTAEIKKLNDIGFVDGVTTNPSLIAKSGRDFIEVIKEICSFVKGPVSAEVVAMQADKMIEEGTKLAKIAPNVTIKLPLTPDGLKACRHFSMNNIPTNVTLCFSPNQALLAAKAGATFISPFVGRLDDIGHEGMVLIDQIRRMYFNYGFKTQILVASARHTEHVRMAATIGADVVTLPPSVIWQLFKHPLTDSGLKAFMEDWAKTGQKI